MAKRKFSQNIQDWIEARKRHHLSHAQVQMARELGMNPKKLGKIDNHDQEPWKAPLPHFIEHLYFKRFGKERPEVVISVEERVRAAEAKRAARKARKEANRRARAKGQGGALGGADATRGPHHSTKSDSIEHDGRCMRPWGGCWR